jgi:hypothetical protein
MAEREIRVFARKRDDVEVERLARALLDYIDHLSPKHRDRLTKDGERALLSSNERRRPKGSAA